MGSSFNPHKIKDQIFTLDIPYFGRVRLLKVRFS